MRERERNGVRLGQPLRDVDGTPLGKVVRLYDWGFAARRGPPILFGREYVLRYDEIQGVRDGVLVIARSNDDLDELAAGEIPRSWRIATPPAFPTAATPGEARFVREDVAAGRVPGAAGDEAERAPVEPPARRVATEADIREYVRTRGQGLAPHGSHSDRQ